MTKGLYLAAIALLLWPIGSRAQESRQGKYVVESSAQFWMGAALDFKSSQGKAELNPFLRNSEGRFDGRKFLAVNAAFYLVTVALQRKWPRAMNWTRRLTGWGHAACAIGNYRVDRGELRRGEISLRKGKRK